MSRIVAFEWLPLPPRVAQGLLVLLSAGLGGLLTFGSLAGWPLIGVKVVFIMLLAAIGIIDLYQKRVTPTVTLPLMGLGLVRAAALQDLSFLPFWLVVFMLWSFNFFGGGDAKLLMGLFAMWPDPRLFALASAVSLAVGIPFLIAKYRNVSLSAVAGGLITRVITFSLLPTAEELDKGIPFAFVYCLAGAIYLWTVHP